MNKPDGSISRDGFASARERSPALVEHSDGEHIPLILRHRDVRAAAKDWETFSSDAPFRVPIPSEEKVRRVRQIPIELDPPQHAAYRKLIEPWFLRPTRPDYVAKLDGLVARMIAELCEQSEVDVANHFALPMQSRALAILLAMPECEAERWIEWGNSLYREGDGEAKGKQLDDYYRAQIERARSEPEAEDFFAFLTRLEIDGKPLSDDELAGIANLTFAGGRDTVINAISELVAIVAQRPDLTEQVAAQPSAIHSAVEELVRWVSPLSFIGRVCPDGARIKNHEVPRDGRVGLCWLSANYDEGVFANPEEFRPDRKPNPHMGFGSGRHACLGAAHARALLRVLFARLAPIGSQMQLLEMEPAMEQIGTVRRRLGYKNLTVRVSSD